MARSEVRYTYAVLDHYVLLRQAQPEMLQAWTKKVVSKDDWEKKLAAVKVAKEDMNRLVMDFLVTEVSCRHLSTLLYLLLSCYFIFVAELCLENKQTPPILQ